LPRICPDNPKIRENVISITDAVLIGVRPTGRQLLSIAAARATPESGPPAPT
jgi:hypothetical protein